MIALPPVTATSLDPAGQATISSTERDATRYALLHAYSGCFAAKIQLHGVFADELPSEYQLVLEAARDIANLVRALGDLGPKAACFFAVVRTARQCSRIRESLLTPWICLAELDDRSSGSSA